MTNNTQVKCPSCGTSIDMQDILAHQLEVEIKQKYQSQLASEHQCYEQEHGSMQLQGRSAGTRYQGMAVDWHWNCMGTICWMGRAIE